MLPKSLQLVAVLLIALALSFTAHAQKLESSAAQESKPQTLSSLPQSFDTNAESRVGPADVHNWRRWTNPETVYWIQWRPDRVNYEADDRAHTYGK